MSDLINSDFTFDFSMVMPEFLSFFSCGYDFYDRLTSSSFKYVPQRMYPAIFKMRDFLSRLGTSSVTSFSDLIGRYSIISELISQAIDQNSIIADPVNSFFEILFENECKGSDTDATTWAEKFLSLCKRSVTLTGDGFFVRSVLAAALNIPDPPHISLICKRPVSEDLTDGMYNIWKNGLNLTVVSEYGLERVRSRLKCPFPITTALSHVIVPGRSYLTSQILDVSEIGRNTGLLSKLVEDTVYREISERFRRSSRGNLFYKRKAPSDEMLVSGMFCHPSDDGIADPMTSPMNEGGAIYDILTLTPHNCGFSDCGNRIGKNLITACRFLDESIPLTVMPRIVDCRRVRDSCSLFAAVEDHCRMMPLSYSGGAVLRILLDTDKYFPASNTLRRAVSAFLSDGGFMISFSSGGHYE